MNTDSILPSPLIRRRTAYGAAVALTLLGFVPTLSIADEGAASKTDHSVADVPLSDLDLSTPEGLGRARDRLRVMADALCAARGGAHEQSSHPAFDACVESTVASALRGLKALRQTNETVRSSVTLGASVSLADLDLSTLEGERVAQQRFDAMARRICSELGRRQDLPYQWNRATCVQDALAGAWAQANVIRAANGKRTASRTTP